MQYYGCPKHYSRMINSIAVKRSCAEKCVTHESLEDVCDGLVNAENLALDEHPPQALAIQKMNRIVIYKVLVVIKIHKLARLRKDAAINPSYAQKYKYKARYFRSKL